MEPQNKIFVSKKKTPWRLPKVEFLESLPDEDTPDKFEKIVHYAEKYRIGFTKAGHKTTFRELATDIEAYEKKRWQDILLHGKDTKYDEYGLFIISK